jgi:hypothetical protein
VTPRASSHWGGRTSIKQGKYYETQIGNKSRVIAWSHRSRFETAVGLINRPVVKRRLLEVDGGQFYTHFGFNWRRMRDWVRNYKLL